MDRADRAGERADVGQSASSPLWHALAAAAVTGLWLLASASGVRLVYNPTESEPRGWYIARPVSRPLARGQLILFPVPASVAGLVAERRWLPPGVPLLKQVSALAGDTVCVDAMLRLRSDILGPVLTADAAGRPLPLARRGCVTVAPGYLFPIGASDDGSFDARYFGPIPETSIEATAVPLWTFPRRPFGPQRPEPASSPAMGIPSSTTAHSAQVGTSAQP